MKIQCDVCGKEEASVFCTADEAALCDGCDHCVHHANKVASKHIRFSLQHPSFKESPRCDICQERRAFLFCREDRAILCRECDIPIHKANEHTQNHNRFLLTSVKLSAPHCSTSSSSPPPALSSSNSGDLASDSDFKSPVSNHLPIPSSTQNALPSTNSHCRNDYNHDNSLSTSSISEYLMETLPEWRVDNFLDPLFSAPDFCKFPDCDAESDLNSFPMEDLAIWVPQAPTKSAEIPPSLSQPGAINAQSLMKIGRKWNQMELPVPRICPSLKKARQFW